MVDIKNERSETDEIFADSGFDKKFGFGAMMRAAREGAGYSVERVAMSTRISAPFIEALETEQLDKLPGAIFGRGFVRNLCKAYGKPSDIYLEALEDLIASGGAAAETGAQGVRDEKRHQQLKKGVLLIQPKEWQKHLKNWAPHHYLRAKPLIFIGLSIVLVLFIINVKRISSMAPVISEVAPTLQVTEPAPSLEASATPQQAPLPAPLAAVAPSAPIESAVPNQLEVELRVLEPVVVNVSVDQEKTKVDRLLVQTYHFKFAQQLKLYVENTAAVEIYFKGQRVGGNFAKGEAQRFTFAAAPEEIAKKSEAPDKLTWL